jgi:hypothetical protein
MNFSRLVQSTILVAALVIGTQAHAVPTSYGTYYDETATVSCGNATSCRVDFTQLPSNNLLLVNKIECVFSSQIAISTAAFYIATTAGGTSIARHLPLPFVPSQPGTAAQSDGSFRYTVDVTTQWLVGQGRFPYVFFQPVTGTGLMSGDCTLIGTLVTPIQ